MLTQPTYLLNRTLYRDVCWASTLARTLLGGGRVLDVGCGSAPYSARLREDGWTYHGSDIGPSGRPSLVSHGEALSVMTGSLDFVMCSQVLEHTIEPQRVLAEVSRSLREGGVAVVSVPFCFPFHPSPGDYFRFTESGLRSMLEKAGLTPIAARAQGGSIETLVILMNMALVAVSGAAAKRRWAKWLAGIPTVLIFTMNAIGAAMGRLPRPKERWRALSFPANFLIVSRKSVLDRTCP